MKSLLLVGLMVTFKYIYQVIFTLTSVIGKNNKFHQFFIGETIFCLLFWLFFVSIQNHDDNDALRYLVLFVKFKKPENTHGEVSLLVKLQAEKQKCLHRKCFLMNFTKYFRTVTLWNTYKRLLLKGTLSLGTLEKEHHCILFLQSPVFFLRNCFHVEFVHFWTCNLWRRKKENKWEYTKIAETKLEFSNPDLSKS